MKKIISLIFLMSFFVVTAACSFENPEVIFGDENLERVVRDILDKEEGSIYASNVRNITALELIGENITNLEGLQYFTSLEKLDLEDNFVEDVSPLAELEKLTWLNLRNNEITNLAEINFSEITALPLEYLSLRHNVVRFGDDQQIRISDIKILAAFTDLETLDLRDNQITDISSLKSLTKLTYLDISQNPLLDKTLSDLENLVNLTYLNIRETGATDLEVLSNLVNLEYLNIHSNTELTSIAFLSDLTEIDTLVLQNVHVGSQISVLANLNKLIRINLQNTGITDLTVIKDLMASGALQDKVIDNIQADVNIAANPLSIEEYAMLEPYWHNVSIRVPATLPTENPTTPFINEFMASNGEAIKDFYNNSEDWIEIYNPTSQSLDISGYFLSDNFENIMMWEFPQGTIIPANGYLVVFASGKDLITSTGEIHTNFSISRDGEALILTDQSGEIIIDYVPEQIVPRDYSYGRKDDGSSQWVYFDLLNLTPGNSNDSATPYYEDDSIIPTDFEYNIETFERLFNDQQSKNIIIKISETEWNNYDQEMIAYSEQFNGELRTDYYAKADFLYEDEEGEVFVGNVGFRTRGNFSRVRIQNDDGSLNMSNFKISFHETFSLEEYSFNKLRRVFELEEIDLKWNRNEDPTYLTEKFSLDLMRDFGVHAAHTTLANVYIEISGERYYYGVYTLFEPIDEEFLERRFVNEQADGDLYKSLWQQFGPASLRTDYPTNAIGIKDVSINYRPTYDLKTNKDTFDPTDLRAFISSINSLNGQDFDDYISERFDVDRFLRYLAVGALLGNPDDYRAMANNYFLYNDPVNDVWTIIPYDYDHGLGQGWDGAPIFTNWTVDTDIYSWGNLNAYMQGKTYANPLSDKILKIDRYQIQYENYLEELINPDNSYFNYDYFYTIYDNHKSLYQTDLGNAMMSLPFGLRNVEWYFTAKTQSVSSQLSYYRSNPTERP